MKPLNHILTDIFSGFPQISSKNTKRVLKLLTNVPEHTHRLESILSLSGNADVSVSQLNKMLGQDLDQHTNDTEEIELLIQKPLSGRNLNLVKEYTPLWLMHGLYWGYGFYEKTDDEILSVYNDRIGDIALKYIEFYHKMKQKEEYTGDNKHLFSFYEFIVTGKVRAIEFLIEASYQESNYLNSLYIDIDHVDLDLNFFNIQNTNKWESDSLYVVKAGGRNVMKYENEDEELEYQVLSSRMLKHGSVNNFEDAHHKTLQLYHLEGANHNSKYASKPKQSRKSSGVLISTIVEELDDELIPLVRPLPRGLSSEEKVELEAIARPKHRDMSSRKSKKSSKETVCDSNYAQHVINRAFSSNVSKKALVLPSDYNIPELEHLSAFAANALLIENDSEKLYASTFVLLISLGCLFKDLVNMLKEEKDALFLIEDGIITTKIDNTFFPKDINELLENSEHKISFELPIVMNMLVMNTKYLIKCSNKTNDELFDAFKLYLKNAVNSFGSKISLKPNQLYKTMKLYARKNASDLLSSCFATGAYSKDERAKLFYAAVRSGSANHSQIITSLWLDLGFDSITRKIIGLNESTCTTYSVEIPEATFSGSPKCVKPSSSREFFDAITSAIAEYDIGSYEAFNLASIGVRFSTSLLVGTRNFANSANYESASFSEAMMMVNEKASTIPAGMRVIPMCPTITSLMEAYYEDFLQPRGLDKNIWLIDDGKPTLFSSKKAYSILSKMPNINNKAILEQYVKYVPLNVGRHCFTKKAIELGISTQYISAYMGHYFAGAEQLGIYSTMDVLSYSEAVKSVTSQIAFNHGIKDRLW